MKKSFLWIFLSLLSIQASATWVTDAEIETLCRKSTPFSRDLPACIMQFKEHQVSSIALEACYNYTTFDKDLDECALKLMDQRYSSLATKACKEVSPFDNQQINCLYDLRNLDITASNLQICLDSSRGGKIKECLQKISDPFDDDHGGPIGDREIIAKLQRAIRLIDNDEIDSAKRALKRLINDISNRDSSRQ